MKSRITFETDTSKDIKSIIILSAGKLVLSVKNEYETENLLEIFKRILRWSKSEGREGFNVQFSLASKDKTVIPDFNSNSAIIAIGDMRATIKLLASLNLISEITLQSCTGIIETIHEELYDDNREEAKSKPIRPQPL